MTSDRNQRQLTGLEIADQWAKLPPEHLQVALKALEPQLVREHEYRMAMLRVETQQAKDQRAFVRHLAGLITGFGIAVGMLIGAVILGMNSQPWLATALTGPSVFALVKIFVLRQATTDDLKQLRRAQPTRPPVPETSAPPQA